MLKKTSFKIGILLLIIYSFFIIYNEFLFGQLHVRQYLTDIKGDVILFGINTTFTTIFLVLIAYNFFLCTVNYKKSEKSDLPFFVFQTALFLYLAIDERFMIHESLGYHLGFKDAFLLVSIGLFELIILYYYKELNWKKTVKSYALYLGGLFFGIMILIDTFGAKNGILRLSFEDLSKTWAIFFLFIYSFEFYKLMQKGCKNEEQCTPKDITNTNKGYN
ncbi:hypothetical protein [Muriicola sp. Z0-33]|uniref:hypothetical protein n=1 Tax=Muriicola sp. Z0-33 TaxID=2816957 RepID=UPI002237CBF6|nr:hypothetical protein [Muriicola sp. Z0-33]MCW5518103.1 hypothetical protein [Muriicola sp. Z0-33]